MADHDREWDAAFVAQQRREAEAARQRAHVLREDADYRRRSAAEHQASTNEHLRRGIHRTDEPLNVEADR